MAVVTTDWPTEPQRQQIISNLTELVGYYERLEQAFADDPSYGERGVEYARERVETLSTRLESLSATL
jgi:hypothetical protein